MYNVAVQETQKRTTYSQMQGELKLFARKQLFYLRCYRSAHETPDIIDWSHVDLLLTTNNIGNYYSASA